jgi:hypothetical protein
MLGYTKTDHDDMLLAVESVLTTVNSDNDPWLYNNLVTVVEFLGGLWAEGYFD